MNTTIKFNEVMRVETLRQKVESQIYHHSHERGDVVKMSPQAMALLQGR